MSHALPLQEVSEELDFTFQRAAPDAVCSTCKRAYRLHPFDNGKLAYDGHPFLRVICDGRRVKL